jgi:hypothetical protein
MMHLPGIEIADRTLAIRAVEVNVKRRLSIPNHVSAQALPTRATTYRFKVGTRN